MAILELVQIIRSDHAQFGRYQHNSRLVAMLNSFARTDCDLPSGWDRRKDTRSGRVGAREGGNTVYKDTFELRTLTS